MLLVGASGLTGREVLARAAHRNIGVTAVVRPQSISRMSGVPAGIQVVAADPLNPAELSQHVPGQDVVVCTIGQNRRTRSPWSALTSPPDTISKAARALAQAADENGVRLGVLISANGVADSRERTSLAFRWLVEHSKIALSFADSAQAEVTVAAADTRWLVLRPTLLAGRKQGWRPLDGIAGLRSTISRAALAEANLDAVEAGGAITSPMSITGGSPPP